MLKIHFPALVLQIKIYLIIPLLRYCPQPNPYRVHPVSRNARCAASCGVSPKTLHFFILLPSALPTIPSNCILPSGNLQAYAPIGIWQSPPVPFKNSRSAHVISSVTISASAPARTILCRLPAIPVPASPVPLPVSSVPAQNTA